MRRYAVLLFLMPLLFAGCIFYEQNTELNEDGSGDMEIHYWISENMLSWFKGGTLSFNEDSVRAQYACDGVEVRSLRTESRDSDSTRHVYVSLQFDDITRLSECSGFSNVGVRWMREGDVYRFVQTLPSTNNSGDGMLDSFTFTYRYDFPGLIRQSNADTVRDNHAVWVFNLSDLNKENRMEAVIVAPSGTSVWWVGGIIAMVLLAAFVLYLRRKRQ